MELGGYLKAIVKKEKKQKAIVFMSSPLKINVQKVCLGAFATSQVMKPTVRIIPSPVPSSRDVSAYQMSS